MDDIESNFARERLAQFERRDQELWFVVLVVCAAAGVALAALVLPDALRGVAPAAGDRFLTRLVLGLVALLALTSIYLVKQRHAIKSVRAALIYEVTRLNRIEAESFVDPLTRTYNRRYFDDLIVREASRADRADGVFSLLMIDVNDFKGVNDRFGHLEGDRFLREVAGVITRSFRKTDIVVRYGGDEFVVLMPDTREAQASVALARLVEAVADWNEANRSSRYSLELSFGLASYTKGSKVGTVLDQADRRMYSHKSAMRRPSIDRQRSDTSETPPRAVTSAAESC